MSASQAGSQTFNARLSSWVPIVDWLPRYQRAWLVPDVIAALTIWALVVPQAIAYAEIAGLPPQAGLFATLGGLLGYALLGTSRQLVVSPTSSTAAISASLVAAVALGDPDRFAALSATLAITLGVTFGVLGLLRLGFVSRFIPPAVSVGFMFGLGLTIMVGQLTKILGVPSGSGTFFEQLGQLVGKLPDTNVWTLALGVAALAALLIAGRVAPTIPMALIVVVGGIVAVAVLGLADRGVAVIGLIDGAVPMLAIPRVEPGDFMALIPGALAIAVIGYAETNQVAETFAREHKYEIRPNQELLAIGGSNVLAGLLQGFIVGGGASQSAAADRAGARTLLATLIVAGLTLLTSTFLLPLFRDLPQAVLGAIVISAVVGFLRVDSLRRISRLHRDAFLMSLFALGATLVLGILPGLIVAVILSLVLVLVHFARLSTSLMGIAPQGDGLVAVERDPQAQTTPGLVVVRLNGPLMFLNAKLLRDEARARLAAATEPVRVVIIDLELSAELDIESLDMLLALHEDMVGLNGELWLSAVRRAVRDVLARCGVTGEPPGIRVFGDTREAIDAYRSEGSQS